jgi:hypothetical protein
MPGAVSVFAGWPLPVAAGDGVVGGCMVKVGALVLLVVVLLILVEILLASVPVGGESNGAPTGISQR